MTNKRKIQILKKVIKAFEIIIPRLDNDKYAYRELGGNKGICDYIYFEILNPQSDFFAEDGYRDTEITEYIQSLFRIRMPTVSKDYYKWSFTKQGYQARIRACKNAIKRLEKK